MAFIPLHLQSGFSYLRSGLRMDSLIKEAKRLSYSRIGLSDHMNLNGFASFYHLSKENNITPVFGMDLVIDEETYSLFVQNEVGYKNLLHLAYLASKNEVTLDELILHQEGLDIVYDLGTSFLKDHYKEDIASLSEALNQKLRKLKKVILGLPYLKNDNEYVSFLREFSKAYSYPLMAFPLIRYLKKEDAIVILITKAIQEHMILSQKSFKGDEYFLDKETIESFYSFEEIELTEKIGKGDFNFLKKRGSLIHYQNLEGLDSKTYLRNEAFKGLKRLALDTKEEYITRLNYELDVINTMGYDDYFLVVADYVRFAKENNILVGPGRGSGPASLVSYALDISTIDPLKHGLLFERFLNPQRSSMPDIDVDFSDVNRDLVVSYLQRKYGSSRVGRVLTNQTIMAKEALRDIGRVYGYPEREISLIISSLKDEKLSLRDNYKISKPFRDLVNSDNYYLEIVSLASKIEGLPRQSGIHAAGIILNDEPLDLVMPSKDDSLLGYIGCLEKDYLEEQGFLKMDLLGLRNLTIIDRCLSLINKRGVKLSFEDIPYEDEKAISLIKNHDVIGLFQLESNGMQRAIDLVKPTTFEDVVALIALFRPGPMEQIPTYARRKNKLEEVTYLLPQIEEILSSTYGVIIYQEQIMQITQKVAGFSLGEADLFRRAISKKNKEKLASYKDKFIKGCLNNKIDESLALSLFDLILAFANYGFNKAHAVSYGIIACKMAYLKHYYKEEFYCSLFDNMSLSDPKFKVALKELSKNGIFLSLPSINSSRDSYSLDERNIRLPLTSIKGLHTSFIRALIDERDLNGKFLDIFDFALRMKEFGLNQSNFVRLIDAGCFDEFNLNRASLRANVYPAIQYATMIGSSSNLSLLLDLGIEKPALKILEETKKVDLKLEYESLGMMISSTPLSFLKEKIISLGGVSIGEALKLTSFKVAGMLRNLKIINTKKGERMAFIDLYDGVNEMSLVIFKETYDEAYPLLKMEAPLLIEGYLGKKGYVGNKITPLGE